jgi:uncharacterized protein
MTRLTTATQVEDFLRGSNFMSASGGGDPVVERRQLLADLEAGREIGWVPLSAFAPDDVLFCTCYSGAIAPEVFTDQTEAAAALGGAVVHDHPFLAAVALLERQLGVTCRGLISVEIGGINSGAILSAAARLGLPLADADYSGRAIPELHATALELFGAPVLPFACADYYGNETVILAAASNAWAERIGKHLAQASLGIVGCAFAALPATRAAEIAMPGTLSEALQLGRAIREAPGDPVQAAADALDGWVLFRGTVTHRDWENNGYMEGRHVLEGTGDFSDHRLEVWFRNENHVSWLDGEAWVASPDLIEFCDPETAEPLVNTHLEVGQALAVVGMRRRPAFDSPAGLSVLGPEHFGFDLTFRGIEELVAQ